MIEPVKVTDAAASRQAAESARAPWPLAEHWPVVGIALAGAAVLLLALGKASLHDWDEAIYAQISKEIVTGGDWWTLHWGYRPYLRKPPVFMWATAILYSAFGVSEFWARAASAFSGIGLLVVSYFIAKRVYDRWVGVLAAAILLTSYQFVASSRFGTTDIMLTLFTYAAVYGYLRLREGGGGRWWYAVWVCCALAVMTKSAAGAIAPATIMIATVWDGRFRSSVRSREFWLAALVAFLMVAPWHISMLAGHGQAFIDQYVDHSIIDRSKRALDNHTGGRYYYIDRLQKYFFPWVYLAPFAIALGLREIIQGRGRSKVLFVLLALVFGICLMVQTKLRWYIVPLYPALAIMIASMLSEALRDQKSFAFSCVVMAAFVVALLAPLKVVFVFGCAGMALVALWLARKAAAYAPAAFVICAFLGAVGALTLRPLYESGETPEAALARSAGAASREPMIVSSGLSEPAPLFYSGRPIRVVYAREDLTSFVEGQGLREIILSSDEAKSLASAYDLRVIEAAGPLVYAAIEPRGAR